MAVQLSESDKEQILKCLDERSGGQMNDLTLDFAIKHYIQLTETEKENIFYINSFRLSTLSKRIHNPIDIKKKLKILGIKKNLSEYKIVFLLIFNNGDNFNDIGHWSLLVYFPKEKEKGFYHYDSLIIFNIKMSIYIINLLQHHELIDSGGQTFINPRYIIPQKEHWECAYHVLFYMWILIKEYRIHDKKSIELSIYDIHKTYKSLFKVISAMRIK